MCLFFSCIVSRKTRNFVCASFQWHWGSEYFNKTDFGTFAYGIQLLRKRFHIYNIVRIVKYNIVISSLHRNEYKCRDTSWALSSCWPERRFNFVQISSCSFFYLCGALFGFKSTNYAQYISSILSFEYEMVSLFCKLSFLGFGREMFGHIFPDVITKPHIL